MHYNEEPRPGRTPSGYTQRYFEKRYRPKPAAIRLPADPAKESAAEPYIAHAHDYNVVSMSDFKINPSLYMHWTKESPLAVTRYGRIYAMVLSLPFYNSLLERVRDVTAKNIKLNSVIDMVNPALAKLVDQLPEKRERKSNQPYWPMLNQEPKRRFSSEVTRQDLLDALERIDALYELQRPEGLFPDPDRDGGEVEELDPYDEM